MTAPTPLEFISDIRFHKSYTLPPDPSKGRTKPHRFSYADFGDANSSSVVLFCGGLFGMRMSYSILDGLAKENNVRIIHPDRPGMGGSDAVELDQRISTWLEMVPALLSHLGIQHISIACHSVGTIYALNTFLTYPELLHPTKPYIAFFAPWVHYSHSKVGKMQATEYLPEGLIGMLSPAAKFVNSNIAPVSAASGGFLKGMKNTFTGSGATKAASQGSDALNLDDPKSIDALRDHIVTFLFAESTEGASADTLLLLKRPQSIVWCSPTLTWNDFDDVSPLLSKIIAEEATAGKKRKWLIDAFHPESDHLVGDKGRDWFDACWAEPTGYEYRRQVVKGGDHDFLLDPVFGATRTWLGRVKEAFNGDGAGVGA